jgi:hypothetical protein
MEAQAAVRENRPRQDMIRRHFISNTHVELAVAKLDGIGGERFGGRASCRTSVAQVESCAMQRAYDLHALDGFTGEGPGRVSTAIRESKIGVVDATYQDLSLLDSSGKLLA